MIEAIVAGIIAQVLGSLIASFLQRNRQPTSTSIIEYIPESETVTVRHSVIRLGPIAFERTTTETHIEGATFRIPERPNAWAVGRLQLLAGFVLGVVVFFAALLL